MRAFTQEPLRQGASHVTRMPARARTPPKVQTRLTVNAPGDAYEQEADRIAERVLRAPEPGSQRACPCGGGCPRCGEAQGARLHLRAEGVRPAEAGEAQAPPAVHEVLRSAGEPLEESTREFMESRLGQDFSDVRVHTDARAAESARSLNALAYTVGRDVVFGAGQYAPQSRGGKRLLAHELTHVAQQRQAAHAVQRQPINDKAVNVDPTASEVEALVLPGKDEKAALEKLNALDMRDLLNVVEKIYDDASADEKDEGKRRSFGLLNGDLSTAPNKQTASVNVTRLRAAFDAAPVRKQRNPNAGKKDPGTNPTLSGSRKAPATPAGVARPGDWGEDPAGNTWVCHTDGIRTYFGTTVPGDRRSSAWLGNNPGNADYVKEITKRAIGSFHWGKGTHDFAIYLSFEDGAADLRDRVRQFATIGGHVRAHLGNNPADNNSFDTYITNMQKKAKVSPDDPTANWTTTNEKWKELLEGFKSAEGWVDKESKEWKEPLTAANVGARSSDPKDAHVVAYYRILLGAPQGGKTP